jgi:hypothetical protein
MKLFLNISQPKKHNYNNKQKNFKLFSQLSESLRPKGARLEVMLPRARARAASSRLATSATTQSSETHIRHKMFSHVNVFFILPDTDF